MHVPWRACPGVNKGYIMHFTIKDQFCLTIKHTQVGEFSPSRKKWSMCYILNKEGLDKICKKWLMCYMRI